MKQTFTYITCCIAAFLLFASFGASRAYAQANPYIAYVHEFVPAPGQYTNVLPEYEEDDTYSDMLLKAEEQLVGQTNGLISLGAWGGYITFAFDHPLVNLPGQYDLLIYGNAFISNTQDFPGYTITSSEPGIVYVSIDENEDGLPNDTWYEIAGSEAARATYNYQVVYTKVGRAHVPWKDNQGTSGIIARNKYHTQDSYFPLWHETATATFNGTLLPSNLHSDNNAFSFEYGYVDNWPNDDERSKINLDWAIDSNGKSVHLTHVHFIRVMTGVMQSSSLTGEASTEVCGAQDLHPDADIPSDTHDAVLSLPSATKQLINGQLIILINKQKYNILGSIINL